jgi:hypothetical protein
MEDNIKIDTTGQINNICCICYNDVLTLFLTCNHIICLECITNIKKLCCPLCRAELSYLPKKIVDIINSNSNNNITISTNNYLSLIHNVVPLSLSSSNNLRHSTNQNLSPLSLLNPNLSSLSSTIPNSLVNNNLSLYEQYFNDLAFIDIDDIIHYGFINSMNENNGDNVNNNYVNEDNDVYESSDRSESNRSESNRSESNRSESNRSESNSNNENEGIITSDGDND